jgi:hypothetical protein
MSEQNLQISILEIKDLSSVVINIKDISQVIINIQNRVKKYNINNNIILSQKDIIKHRLNKQLNIIYKPLIYDPDLWKCICITILFFTSLTVVIFIRDN